MRRLAARSILAALWFAASVASARAESAATALSAANSTFAKIDDYQMTIVVHETDGARVEDRTYGVLFKKPSLEKIDIVAGPGKGGGIVWLGGDKVKGHRGGLLGGIHLTFDIHNSQVSTLRGDSVDTATIPAMLGDFTTGKGTISEAPGPQIDGAASSAVTLDVADPTVDKGVTREVLYLSDTTHLPLRRERFAGTELVKSENVTEMKTNVGLTTNDFPW
jgi:outer membrane lipoprotein-sorting protein